MCHNLFDQYVNVGHTGYLQYFSIVNGIAMNVLVAHTNEWLRSMLGSAGSKGKNRLWDKLLTCPLEEFRGYLPVFSPRISIMF